MKLSNRGLRGLLLATTIAAGVTGSLHAAQAGLALTAAGIADGFVLSTFASGFQSVSGVGPIGVGFFPGGGTVVTDYTGSVVTFTSDTDGQTVSGTGTTRSGYTSPAGAVTIGGTVYVAQQSSGTIVQLNSDGTMNRTVAGGLSSPTGLAVNPNTGHLLVSSDAIYDVDPASGAITLFRSGTFDGLSVSPDGTTLYAESSGHVFGFLLSTATQNFDSGFISGADGAAAAGGSLAGNLIVNSNDGTVYLVNVTSLVTTLIASGGSRGDLVTVDPNGSLLLSQTDSVLRLTLPSGSSFVDAPEPASMTLLIVGIAAVGALRRRKR